VRGGPSRVGGINIHHHPMFGWLKFVGLAGNFAPLPPCNRLCDDTHTNTCGYGEI